MQKVKGYYEILGVPRTASVYDIKKAYKELAKKYHPDINRSHDAVERFKEINEAYTFLIQAYHSKAPSEPTLEDEIKGCHYHISPHKGELKKCRFCDRMYCSRHSIPHPPKLGPGHAIPDEKHPCPDCPECPYCKNRLKHPEPYKDPYFGKGSGPIEPPYQCHRCKKWVTIDTRHRWKHDCTQEEKPTSEEKPTPPEKHEHPEEENLRFFSSQVFDVVFDERLNEKNMTSL